MTTAKICGLRTPETVRAALDGGASHLGFVTFADSPRNIAPAAAARLAAPARGRAAVVAVLVDPDDALLDEVARALSPDLIQLHGREPPARVAEVRARTGACVIKAIGVSDASDIAAALRYGDAADHVMLDARPPRDATLPGGVGARFDWSLAADFRPPRPWFLAGGLDAFNVAAAIAAARPPIVDVSSGVERGPGVKDPARILAFLDAVGLA